MKKSLFVLTVAIAAMMVQTPAFSAEKVKASGSCVASRQVGNARCLKAVRGYGGTASVCVEATKNCKKTQRYTIPGYVNYKIC